MIETSSAGARGAGGGVRRKKGQSVERSREADRLAVEELLSSVSGGGLSLSERVMCIAAEHSERAVFYWDFTRDVALALNGSVAEAAGLPSVIYSPLEHFLELAGDYADSASELRALFEGICGGLPGGEMKLHLRGPKPGGRWHDLRMTRVSGCGRLWNGAVVSLLEVTKLHMYETAFARYRQSLDSAGRGQRAYLEANLTANLVDKSGGELLGDSLSALQFTYDAALRRLVESCFTGDRAQCVIRHYSRSRLIREYDEGRPELLDDWLTSPVVGCPKWLRVTVQMVSDPYSEHVRALCVAYDVTDEKNRLLRVQRQAESDMMTGLYNRVTAEELICLKLAGDERGGALLIIDLDDFKSLNDSLGHAQGDLALCMVAEELKKQFRSSDIIGRLGGDEFVAFLPGVTRQQDAVAPLLSLLQRLSAVTVGECGERTLNCSIGAAVSTDESCNFNELYRQADAALYSVKRGGKNGYAFYGSERAMADDDAAAQ